MKKTMISMALLALIGAPGAVAQSGSKGTTVGSTINGTIPEAPVGHRQPRAATCQTTRRTCRAIRSPRKTRCSTRR